jgi:NADPH:quinone reductase-like Zn-dependent oxidoreductase
VKSLPQGHGVDHIFEVGLIKTLLQCFKTVVWNGIIHSIGHITNMTSDEGNNKPRDATFLTIDVLYMLRRINVGFREQFQDLLSDSTATCIRPVVNPIFEFRDATEAYEYLWSSSHMCKVVIRISSRISQNAIYSYELCPMKDDFYLCGLLEMVKYHLVPLYTCFTM